MTPSSPLTGLTDDNLLSQRIANDRECFYAPKEHPLSAPKISFILSFTVHVADPLDLDHPHTTRKRTKPDGRDPGQ